MDEYNRGMEPEVKRYFKKIINSFSVGLMWLLSMATGGLFFGLGEAREKLKWYNVLFYIVAFTTFIGLLYYYYKIWSKKDTMP